MFTYIKARTVGEGIESSLKALQENGIIQQRENQNRSEEMKEIQLCLDVEEPLSEPAISKSMPCSLEQLWQYDQ